MQWDSGTDHCFMLFTEQLVSGFEGCTARCLSAPNVPQTNSIVHCILNLSISQKEIAFGSVDEACVATCDFFKLGLDGSAPSIKRPVQLTAYYSPTHMHKDSSEELEKDQKCFQTLKLLTFILQNVSFQWKNIISFSLVSTRTTIAPFFRSSICCIIILLLAVSNQCIKATLLVFWIIFGFGI